MPSNKTGNSKRRIVARLLLTGKVSGTQAGQRMLMGPLELERRDGDVPGPERSGFRIRRILARRSAQFEPIVVELARIAACNHLDTLEDAGGLTKAFSLSSLMDINSIKMDEQPVALCNLSANEPRSRK
ncbi:hypothetical protein [Burkholderia ubonensis]|uniref:hypothetical protein n=1 Tax=Burkholderia ubonensis TaxID=101571 RepID=UPI0018DFAF86